MAAIGRTTWVAAFAAILLMTAATASAKTLAELRADGTVGERYDGIAVVRKDGASEKVKRALAKVNEKRREIYRERAAEEGVTPEQVGRVYARQIYDKAPSGTWFLSEAGEWRQKP